MILVDTSVWVDHLRRGNELLGHLLEENAVVTHPLVLGELSAGNISKRSGFLHLLRQLPMATEASHEDVLVLIERHRLWGLGLGYSDLHLLCSSLIASIPLWTLDKKLSKIAKRIAGIQGATASLP